jgi:phospholipase/carboxylesterase
MQPDLIGPLRVHATGGSDRRGGGSGPAILLCHGFGAPGSDLVPFARMVDAGRDVRWFFPEAPIALDHDGWSAGRAWWLIDLERLQQLQERARHRKLAAEMPAGLLEARAALEATIAELEQSRGVRRAELIVGGFSQGAMLTTEVALHNDRDPFAGLVILSGNLLCADRWAEAARKTGPSIHAFMTHGRADPLLPFEGAEALRALLEAAGAEVAWVPHGGQHEIGTGVLDRVAAFARARLGSG